LKLVQPLSNFVHDRRVGPQPAVGLVQEEYFGSILGRRFNLFDLPNSPILGGICQKARVITFVAIRAHYDCDFCARSAELGEQTSDVELRIVRMRRDD
jgi:hypothetical protein